MLRAMGPDAVAVCGRDRDHAAVLTIDFAHRMAHLDHAARVLDQRAAAFSHISPGPSAG